MLFRSAMSVELALSGAARFTIVNRTQQRGEELVELLKSRVNANADFVEWTGDYSVPEGTDVVINATSIGLSGEEPPFPESCVGPNSFCYDLAYSLKDTPFVVWARRLDAMEAVQGWGMLVEQAAESFEIWRGVRPDTAPILQHMKR